MENEIARPDVYFSNDKEQLRIELKIAIGQTASRFTERARLLGLVVCDGLTREPTERRKLWALQWQIDAYCALESEVDRSLYDNVKELQAKAYRIALKGEPAYFEYMKEQEKKRAETDIEEYRCANISFADGGDNVVALMKWRGLSSSERKARIDFLDNHATLDRFMEKPAHICPCGVRLLTRSYEEWCEFKKAHALHRAAIALKGTVTDVEVKIELSKR